jgi:UDP:flavonoid glycosyltransferase YjiC (YdhE family)
VPKLSIVCCVLAGVPALVLPVAQAADQPFWGDIIQRRKAGRLACKPASKITTEQLAGDLQEVLSGLEGFKQAAMALGKKMHNRQGKQAAVNFVQGMLNTAGSS